MTFVSRRTGIALCFFAVAAVAFTAAYVLKATHEEDIRAAISAQIDAFKRNDGAAAFALAAPAIQRKFKTPNSFMRMVAASYPQAYRPQRIDFLETVEANGHFLQKVLLIDQEGNDAMAVYALVMVDGDWRISGCIISRPPGESI